jgi:hypothetical protein
MYEIESKFEIYLFLIIAAAGRMRRSIISVTGTQTPDAVKKRI